MFKSLKTLPFICLIAILFQSCEQFLDLIGDGTVIVNEVDFTAVTNDEMDNGPENPVTIKAGRSVRFINTSTRTTTDLLDGTANDPELYTGRVKWFFDGGTPESSESNEVEVFYFEPGEYNVTLSLVDENGDVITGGTYEAYVKVEPDESSEPICRIESEINEIGAMTLYEFNEKDQLVAVFYTIAEEFQQIFNLFDEEGNYTGRTLQDIDGNLIAELINEYDENNRLETESLFLTNEEAADLFLEYRYRYESQNANKPNSAVATQPNDQGGTSEIEVELGYDDNLANITSIQFIFKGQVIQSEIFTFDDNPKIFTNLSYFEDFLFKFNTNNITSHLVLDGEGNVINETINSYIYGSPETSCGQPVVLNSTVNGTAQPSNSITYSVD